jgi:hypothetical protein
MLLYTHVVIIIGIKSLPCSSTGMKGIVLDAYQTSSLYLLMGRLHNVEAMLAVSNDSKDIILPNKNACANWITFATQTKILVKTK